MDAFQTRFAKLLVDQIEIKMSEIIKLLINTPAIDYADYRRQVGYVKGLEAALILVRKIEDQLSKPETTFGVPGEIKIQKNYEN